MKPIKVGFGYKEQEEEEENKKRNRCKKRRKRKKEDKNIEIKSLPLLFLKRCVVSMRYSVRLQGVIHRAHVVET